MTDDLSPVTRLGADTGQRPYGCANICSFGLCHAFYSPSLACGERGEYLRLNRGRGHEITHTPLASHIGQATAHGPALTVEPPPSDCTQGVYLLNTNLQHSRAYPLRANTKRRAYSFPVPHCANKARPVPASSLLTPAQPPSSSAPVRLSLTGHRGSTRRRLLTPVAPSRWSLRSP